MEPLIIQIILWDWIELGGIGQGWTVQVEIRLICVALILIRIGLIRIGLDWSGLTWIGLGWIDLH